MKKALKVETLMIQSNTKITDPSIRKSNVPVNEITTMKNVLLSNRETKKLWKIINNVASHNNDKTSIIDCIKVDQMNITKSDLIAKEFGKFFSSIGYQVST